MIFKNMEKKIICILISIFFLFSCSKNTVKDVDRIQNLPLDALYKKAYEAFVDGDWNESISLFKKVEINFAYSEWAPKASLMIIYMYFSSGDTVKTLEYINKFQEFYPKNKNNDYVEYIKGLTFYEQINTTSKDITNAEIALRIFTSIEKKYPKSIYADESKFKIDLINEQIAGKHMFVARYYMSKSIWIPAVKRLKTIIDSYDTTIYVIEALHRLVEIYYKLGNEKEAKKYAAILGYNFNDSSWYKKTYKIILDRNYSIENKNTKKKLKDRLKKMLNFSK